MLSILKDLKEHPIVLVHKTGELSDRSKAATELLEAGLVQKVVSESSDAPLWVIRNNTITDLYKEAKNDEKPEAVVVAAEVVEATKPQSSAIEKKTTPVTTASDNPEEE